jgi:DNA-binding transcriptional LysR family regulator
MLLLSGEVDFTVMYTVANEQPPFFERAFEALVLGGDVLVPVCAPTLQEASRQAQIPCISYPSDVFLGQVFDRNIAPRLKPDVTIATKAETALTLAAYEFALGGIGVAWLPRSLVATSIRQGALLSLEADLPVQPLEIRAYRLLEDRSQSSDAVWQDILTGIELPEHLSHLAKVPSAQHQRDG